MQYSTLTDAIGGVSLGLAGGAASAFFVSQILRLPVVGVLVGIMLCWLYMSAA